MPEKSGDRAVEGERGWEGDWNGLEEVARNRWRKGSNAPLNVNFHLEVTLGQQKFFFFFLSPLGKGDTKYPCPAPGLLGRGRRGVFLIRGREERCLLSSSRSCGRTQRTWKCWHSQMEEALGRACAGGGGARV